MARSPATAVASSRNCRRSMRPWQYSSYRSNTRWSISSCVTASVVIPSSSVSAWMLSATRPGVRPQQSLHGPEAFAVRRVVGAAASAEEHARIADRERLPGGPVHEVALRPLLPEAAAGVLLSGIVTWRRVARTIEPVRRPGVLDHLRVRAGSPEPLRVAATRLDGGELVGRPVGGTGREVRRRVGRRPRGVSE